MELKSYTRMSRPELENLREELWAAYTRWKEKRLKLDMSRGKPGPDQLDMIKPMLDVLNAGSLMEAENGTDTRNYGDMGGIPEAKRLMACLLQVPPENVLVGGNSSLNLMFDAVSRAMTHGVYGSERPWGKEKTVKFLCPSPGYDRHFAVTEFFGIELMTVPMKEDGPDMELVEAQVKDPAVKGIWCVPKYSNPQGITYSDRVVKRFAALSPAAPDFRIFWDNAYAVHDLDGNDRDELISLYDELLKNNQEDMAYIFASTSKITYSGGGISAMGLSKNNLDFISKQVSIQTIGFDKVNQLRHARYLKDLEGIRSLMCRHARILRPKFALVQKMLEQELSGLGIASWTNPKGGYFISLDTLPGCAVRTVALCKEAGVAMTPAGATYPYGKDPEDSNIRIAPTYPSLEELDQAARLLCLCVKIACVEKLLEGVR